MTNAEVVDRRSAELVSVDLPSAPMVVGIGRGLKAQADLTLIEELATALGAELGCSRPLAEGVDWMPKERYIGISGQHIAPRLYMAVGISGQLQHMFGARDSEVIVAVNSDADAPIFAECDYGLVGDLYRIVPALVAALKTPR
jgi:electron transfer flavoprotein alpha subunit